MIRATGRRRNGIVPIQYRLQRQSGDHPRNQPRLVPEFLQSSASGRLVQAVGLGEITR